MEPEGFHDLVRQAQDGNGRAMDQVLEILRSHLEFLARPYTDPARPVESTSDLLQESCLRAWQKIGSFQGGDNDEKTFAMFRAWIGQIVKTLGLNAAEKRDRQRRIPKDKIVPLVAPQPVDSTTRGAGIEPPARDPSPSASAQENESLRQLRAAVKDITDETDAAILRLRLGEGLSLQEIADRLDLPYKKIWARFQAAIARLERDMKPPE